MRPFLCPVLIGRDDALDHIRGALGEAGASQQGSAIFVVGEAGVGKSRLAREAATLAREQGLTVMWGRAAPAHTAVAFRPIAEALLAHFRADGPPDFPDLDPFRPTLARLVPEWRQPNAGVAEESIVVLAEAILRLLRAVGRERGCLLVLDDLHWADPDTLAIVEYLAQNIAAEPIVCLCAARPQSDAAVVGLAHSLVAQRVASTVELEHLNASDTAAMARACLSTDELPQPIEMLLSDHADGLPFLVEELLAGAADSGALTAAGNGWAVEGDVRPHVPRTFADSVEARLATLGDDGAVIIQASVLGRIFDWTLLPAITGLDEKVVLTALHRAVDAQLVVADPLATDSFVFRHALTRDAVARRVLPIERAMFSRRALDAVEAAHPDLEGEWCDLAARLAEDAGERGRGARLLVESGNRSLARGALASAEDAFERARSLADDPEVAADAASGLCEALSMAGKTDRTLEVGAELAASLAASNVIGERLGRVHLRSARAAATACLWDVADEHLALARRAVEEAPQPSVTARADTIAAQVAFGRDDDEQARALAAAALSVAQELHLPDVQCEALEAIGRYQRRRDLGEAKKALETALAVAEAHDLAVWRARALFELTTIDLIEARSNERLLAARELAVASGALATAAQIDMHLAHYFCDRFELDLAVASARRARDTARRFRMEQLLAVSLVAEATALGRLGRRDEMEASLSEALALVDDAPETSAFAWAHARAVVSLIEDNQTRARRELDTAAAHLSALRAPPPFPEWGLWALLRTVHDVDGEEACAAVRGAGGELGRLVRGYLHLADAVRLGRAGRRDGADAAFAAGDAELEPASWFRQHARRLMADAAITDGWGDPVAWMQQALVVFEDHRHDRLAAACRSLLHKAGAPVPRRGHDSKVPASLREMGVTLREFEVLTLLADGLGNKEIAERLYLSPRTVERHIANVTVKSGLRTRSEVIAFAARITSP